MTHLNVPHSWPKMSGYARACYLVNTHQAKNIKAAGQLLSSFRKRKLAEQPCNPQPQVTRLPYKDQEL